MKKTKSLEGFIQSARTSLLNKKKKTNKNNNNLKKSPTRKRASTRKIDWLDRQNEKERNEAIRKGNWEKEKARLVYETSNCKKCAKPMENFSNIEIIERNTHKKDIIRTSISKNISMLDLYRNLPVEIKSRRIEGRICLSCGVREVKRRVKLKEKPNESRIKKRANI